jgi:hypothetical protein
VTPPVDLAAIQARLDAATPGPWVASQELADRVRGWVRPIETVEGGVVVDDVRTGHDAVFIAHAPADVATLLAGVRELEADNERLGRSLADAVKVGLDSVRGRRVIVEAQDG